MPGRSATDDGRRRRRKDRRRRSGSEREALVGARVIDGAEDSRAGPVGLPRALRRRLERPRAPSSGITSVRDAGNLPEESGRRAASGSRSRLLGSRIVLSPDDGPTASSEVGSWRRTRRSARRRAPREERGLFRDQASYGSLEPAWVKPMADLRTNSGPRPRPHPARHAAARRGPLRLRRDHAHQHGDDAGDAGRSRREVEHRRAHRRHGQIRGGRRSPLEGDDRLPRRAGAPPHRGRSHARHVRELVRPGRGDAPPALIPYAETLPAQFERGFLLDFHAAHGGRLARADASKLRKARRARGRARQAS